MLTLGAPVAVHPGADPVGDVRWADSCPGIAAAWLVDHLQGWLPRGPGAGRLGDPHATMDPFTLLGAAAAITSRVGLDVGVTDPLRRAPAVLLQGALTASCLAGRPVILGLGAGAAENLRPYGLQRPDPVGYVREACETITTLRGSTEPQQGGGPIWPRTNAVIGMSGHGQVALWVGAHGPRMIDLTARYADGWFPGGMPPPIFAKYLARLRRQAEQHGRDPLSVRTGMFAWSALAPSRAESARLLAAPVVRATALYNPPSILARHGLGSLRPGESGLDYVPSGISPARARELIASIPDELVRGSVLWGSVDDVGARMAEYEEAGCEHLVLYDVGRYADPDGLARFRESLKALARGRPDSAPFTAGSTAGATR
jgi:phthiodiolone/phenolphthiodiolone dimycocerosates ketoreductase